MDVDDSSSSPSFRELDDVFLQSQARIWLGEVLHTRFDEQISIYDLLSDGELLFEVSKALWNMLLVKYMELNNYKTRMFIPVDTRKSSGRYRPYSNVDSFLKVCKVMGLSGVDLFSPSDVVEKKDTRKVCICIRSLSKKARSKQLNVPDFDIVTKTVAMPTEVVRCIRRSLELSTSSVTHGQSKDALLKFRQKNPFSLHKQEDESFLEESDETKSNFSDTSYADFLYLESGESPETVNKYALTRGNQDIDKFDNQVNLNSSPICESTLIICDEFTSISIGPQIWHDNEEIDHHITLSDMISFRILTNDCFCHSCNSNTTPNTSMCRIWRKFPDDVEASSTSSVSSVVGRVLDFDFDFDAKSESDDLRTLVSSTPHLKQHGAKSQSQSQLQESRFATELEILDFSADSIQQTVHQPGKGFGSVKKEDDQLCTNQSDNVHCYAEDRTKAASKYERKDNGINCLVEENTNGRNEKRNINKEKKPAYIAPLLKTVAKGTALIGILFLLHLRNSGNRYTNDQLTKKSSQIQWKSCGVGFSRRKGEKGSKIYPVEKLKFGD